MKIIYNGALGPQITAGGIPFTAGEPTEVADEAIAAALIAKPHFSASVETQDVASLPKAATTKTTVKEA